MDGHDRLGARGDGAFDEGGVDVEAVLVDVDEDGGGADAADALGGGEEAERGGDDLVAGADAEGAQTDDERVGAGVDADGVLRAEVVAGLAFEGLDLGAADELAAAQHALEGGVEVVPEERGLGAEVEDGDGGGGLGHAMRSTRSGANWR